MNGRRVQRGIHLLLLADGGGIRGINFDPDITYLHAEAFMAGKFANVRAPMAQGRMEWLYMSLDDPCR